MRSAAITLLAAAGLLAGCSSPAAPAATPPAASSPASPTGSPSSTGSPIPQWPTYHRTTDRAGDSPAFPAPHGVRRAWTARLDGAVYAEPLVVDGLVVAATEADSVYALQPASGTVVWHTKLGAPEPRSALPCGNIDPLGVTGTPAYDPRSRLLFVAAELRGAGHELFALDPSTGRVVWRRALPLRGSDPRAMQQRAALTVDGSEVLVAFGGLEGDCGDYHGTVVGVPTDGRGPLRSYVVPTRREGGIWAASGPAVDAAGRLYVAVGNGSSTTRYDGSDSVLELSPALHLLGFFAPSDWRQDNAGDADLGSTGPEPIPGGRLVAAGKAGIVYLLDGGRLGGVGGQLAETSGCVSYGGMASAGDTVFLPCNSGVRELVVTGQRLSWGWAAPAGAAGSPVLGGSTVWTLDAQTGTLFGLAASNGAVQALVYVGAVSRFATPALNGDEVLVGTLSGVTAVAGG